MPKASKALQKQNNIVDLRKIVRGKAPKVARLIFILAVALAGIYSLRYAVQILVSSPVANIFTDKTKIAVSWDCGDALYDSRDGKTYATVQIRSQCWLAQNINIGTMTARINDQGTDCSSAAQIEKYCYNDSETICASDGALFQWGQAMCGSTAAGAQGICPAGWHIPTHDELTTLERAVCGSDTCVVDFPYDITIVGWRGTDEGTKLKQGGSSGFEGLLAGYRDTDGSSNNRGTYAFIWSSVESGSNAWRRNLLSGYTTVYRSTYPKLYGFSVRCLKD